MNANIDYLGMLKLLSYLCDMGCITEKEREKIAARLAVQTGADIIILS